MWRFYLVVSVDWSRRGYTEDEFRAAWAIAGSYNEVCRLLNYSISGGSIRIIKETGQYLGLPDIVYLGKKLRRYTLNEILIENSPYTSTNGLKKRLIKEGLLLPSCSAPFCPFKYSECIDPFTGKPTSLRLALDHIDGNPRNNTIENLRILCQHCHSLTPTWCTGKSRMESALKQKPSMTCTCGNTVTK